MHIQSVTPNRPRQFIDARGIAVLSYLVSGTSRRAVFDSNAIRALDAAKVRRLFHLNHKNGNTYIRARNENGEIVVISRVITGALDGQHVHYLDGDFYNLRSGNLAVIEGRRCASECSGMRLSAKALREQIAGRTSREALVCF